jgi:hypothetical protein
LDGNPILTGKAAKERAVIHMMQRRAEVGLLDAVASYFHHATPGLGPHVESYQKTANGVKRVANGPLQACVILTAYLRRNRI